MTHYVYFVNHPLVRAFPSITQMSDKPDVDLKGWSLEQRDNWLSEDWRPYCCWVPTLDEMEAALDSRRFFYPRDKCEICHGAKCGVRGNENVIDGKLVCDYCTVEMK